MLMKLEQEYFKSTTLVKRIDYKHNNVVPIQIDLNFLRESIHKPYVTFTPIEYIRIIFQFLLSDISDNYYSILVKCSFYEKFIFSLPYRTKLQFHFPKRISRLNVCKRICDFFHNFQNYRLLSMISLSNFDPWFDDKICCG